MFTCPVCQILVLRASEFQTHLKFVHNYGHSNFPQLICPFSSCNITLGTWSGFLRHVKSHDKFLEIGSQIPNLFFEPTLNSSNFSEAQQEINIDFEDPKTFENISVDTGIKIVSEILGNFCSSIIASGVNNSVMDVIVKEMEYVFVEIINLVTKLGKQTLGEQFDMVAIQIRSLVSGFVKVKSSYQRQNLYQSRNNLILPTEISLGSRIDSKIKDAKRQQVVVEDTFMYVPLLKTLEKIIQIPQLYQYFESISKPNGQIFKFCDSESFKNNKLFSKYPQSIQLQLFYDDFETVNPLGSKKGIHKLGALYFILRNLSDFINSQLSQIHLLALFYSEDAKKYGYGSILKHVLPDIKILETTGISIGGNIFRGTVCSVVHDNLGGNSLLGLTESFNSNFFCRICYISKAEIQNEFDHNYMPIRNLTNSCELNSLQFYHFLDSPTADIMHDLLEGVVPYEIKLVFKKLISLGCFNLETVNNRISAFDFGYLESKNKPSPIKLDGTGNRIGQKAAQAWCLIRFLPMILGDLIVDEVHLKYWDLILQLLECMSFIFFRSFNESSILTLKSLIIKHHSLFKFLFPDQNLLPKHHFMCHYPFIIKMSGPLISLWTMRFEGKHNYFAQLAHNNRNFKNICFSLAMRHQQYSSHVFKNLDFHHGIKTDKICKATMSEFDDSFDIVESLKNYLNDHDICIKTEMMTTNQIWFNGYNYKHNFVVCFEMGTIFPKFGIISEFLIQNDNSCLLILKVLETEFFYRHLFAYKVRVTENLYRVINVKDLVTHDAMEIKQNCNLSGLFVISRHFL